MLDHFKGLAFLDKATGRMEMAPLWHGLLPWAIILVIVLIFA